MRIKALFGAALAVALAGCGGGSSSDDNTSDGKPGAGDAAQVEKLLEQTFGPNPKASSGMLSGTIDVTVKGVPRYRDPIQISMSGPFSSSGGAPEANLSLGLQRGDKLLGGDLILADGQVLIGLGSTAYEIPASISSKLRAPLRDSDNALGSILQIFGLAPRRWAKKPRIVGNENVDGVDTIHGTANLDAARMFLDLAKLTKTLTSLRVTEISGLPREIDRAARRALTRSVTSATGDIYTGAEDHVLRRAKFMMTLKPSAADRRTLGGITSVKAAGNLDVTDVGSAQRIKAPRARGSYQELQVTLDAIAESAG